jgi:hypothetical protein
MNLDRRTMSAGASWCARSHRGHPRAFLFIFYFSGCRYKETKSARQGNPLPEKTRQRSGWAPEADKDVRPFFAESDDRRFTLIKLRVLLKKSKFATDLGVPVSI